MRYMLLCYDDEKAWERSGAPALQAARDEAAALTRELHSRNQYVLASPLHPVATATTLRIRDGKRMVTDGPFAETREQLGGFYLIDVDNLDDAIGIAGRHPGARLGSVEIRPVFELAGLPPAGPAAITTPSRRRPHMLFSIVLGLGAVLALAVVVVLVMAAMQPAAFRVSRSTSIAAAPQQVFPHVNDFRKWQAWSPYEGRDPNMKRTYEGPPAGVGTSYAWSGNNHVGEGRTTILESRPGELIVIKLEFVRPFAATNTAEFAFQPLGERTAVTWSLTGNKTFLSKVMCVFMDMDKMCGRDFEQGLANLKSLVESGSLQTTTN